MSTTLTSRLQSFEMELLTQEGNLAGLAAINRELVAKAETIDSPQRVLHTALPVFGAPSRRIWPLLADGATREE